MCCAAVEMRGRVLVDNARSKVEKFRGFCYGFVLFTEACLWPPRVVVLSFIALFSFILTFDIRWFVSRFVLVGQNNSSDVFSLLCC